MSWSNGKQVKNSQTTRVNRSYTLRTHHRIPLLCYASLWLWAVAVQASRHYNSQHYPELLCPGPQSHQSQNMTPTIAPYCKTSLRNSHDLERQKRALYTKPCAVKRAGPRRRPQLHPSPPLGSDHSHLFVTVCSICPSTSPSSKPWGALFTMRVVFVRPACGGSINLLVCQWSVCCAVMVPELPGWVWLWAVWSMPMLCQEQCEHNKRLWTVHDEIMKHTQTTLLLLFSHTHTWYIAHVWQFHYLSDIGSRYWV